MTLETIPQTLQTIQNPVKKLFFKGDLDLLKKKKIAIVGTRRPSSYTKSVVTTIASAISKGGGVVVSGGAMGVDSVAHKGAGENTIGVFANSLDLIYPKTSKNIIQGIYDNSLALSEYPETTQGRPYFFVQRNRIVTGLSDAVIVAEADLNSGSMRSAEFAYNQGKKLFVLPHRLGESEGTNSLLKDLKARAIYDIDNFLEEMELCAKPQEKDEFLEFCKKNSSYDLVASEYGEKLFEYELDGKIEVINGEVVVKG